MKENVRVSLRAGVLAAYGLITVATIAIVRADPDLAVTGDSTGALTADVMAGALVAAAAVAIWRPRALFPGLFAACSVAWLVGDWNTPAAGAAFTPALVLYAAWPPVLAAAALRGLDERQFGRPERGLLFAAFATGVGILGLASALVADPAAHGCSGCPRNLISLADAPGLGRTLGHLGLALTVAWTGAFAVIGCVRLARSSAARRRLSAPVLVPAAVALALVGIDAAHGFDRAFVSNDATDRALHLGEAGALALAAAGVGVARLRTRRTRGALARLVLDIGAAPRPGELRERLAESLGDPSLDLMFRLEGPGWIDSEGRHASLPARGPTERTFVRLGEEEVLAVVHRPTLLDDPELLRELVTTASLALQHERLHAARRARLAELRASRARIVAASDRERRGLERDLHDGAQQRLVALALAIRLARRLTADGPDLDAQLARAEDEVRAAVVDLREVAHGLFPAVLAEEGLGAALDALSESSPRLVPRTLPDRRFESAVESAAYFAAREAVRLSADRVTVDVVAADGRVRVTIGGAAALDGAMVQIRDRVGAVGGTVTTEDGDLWLEMPCAS
jgi:signal transduction histidine kinase